MRVGARERRALEDVEAGRNGERAPTPASRGEAGWLAVLLLLLLLANLATAGIYPVPWMDEVMFADPAAHLAAGEGFRSAEWPEVRERSFFAGYPPLYPLGLAAWLRVTGLSPIGVRSFDYALVTALALVLWLAVRRWRLVARPTERLLLVALVLLGYGMSFSYRSGRPDTLMALLAAAMFAWCGVRSAKPRLIGLFLLGALLPAAGIQLLPYAAAMLVLLLVFLGRRFAREALWISLGAAGGLVLLIALYAGQGVLSEFLASVRQGGKGLLTSWLTGARFHHQDTVPRDLSLVALIPAALLLAGRSLRIRAPAWRSPIGFAIAALIVVPIPLIVLGKFRTYYSWMVYLPLAMGVTSALSSESGSRGLRRIAYALAWGACLVGWPLQMTVAAYDRRDRDPARVMEAIAPLIEPGEWVCCDYEAYYAARARTPNVFSVSVLPRLTDAERRRVTLMIVDPASAPWVGAALGGSWRVIGPEVAPAQRTLTEAIAGFRPSLALLERKLKLQAYRRGP